MHTQNTLTFQDEDILDADGRRIGWLYQGLNGNWFACDLAVESRAFPVGSLEDVSRCGYTTRAEAVQCFAENRP